MALEILIVDDEPFILRVTEMSLKKGGYEVLTAGNGREALELATRERPALIVMDVCMPEMDGFTALRHLKENAQTAAIPVIILTARNQNLTRQEAEQGGAAAYFTKPFSPTQLLAEAKRLIEASGSPTPGSA